MRTYAIIPAAGKGIRSGRKAPKQFIKFHGKELIAYTLDVFQKCEQIDHIIIAAEKKFFPLLERIIKKFNIDKVTGLIEGGKERQDSVYNALSSIRGSAKDLVAVHDAARALLPAKVLENAIVKAKKKGNALVCIKAKDTLVSAKEYVDHYIARENIYYVQTPQVFRYTDLMRAMQSAYQNKITATDESMLIDRIGIPINLVEGSALNFKITSEEDLKVFNTLSKAIYK